MTAASSAPALPRAASSATHTTGLLPLEVFGTNARSASRKGAMARSYCGRRERSVRLRRGVLAGPIEGLRVRRGPDALEERFQLRLVVEHPHVARGVEVVALPVGGADPAVD